MRRLWLPGGKDPGKQVSEQLALMRLVKDIFGLEMGTTDILLALREYTARGKRPAGREPVAVGFPVLGPVSAAFFIGYCRMRQQPQDYMIPVIDTTLVAAARNKCVETFLGSKYNWILFLDSDVVPPADGIDRLMAHGKKVISGLYHQKGGDFLPNIYRYKCWNEETQQHDYDWITEWPKDEVIEVDGVGAGFLLIHREVLEAIGDRGWFHFKEGGEDFAFCRQAKEKGYSVWADTSLHCGHVSYMVVFTDHYYARKLGTKNEADLKEAIERVASGKPTNINTESYWNGIWQAEGPDTWRRYPGAFSRVLAEIRPSESVLDVGCGSGVLLEVLKARTTHLAGMDISAVAVKQVQARGIEARIGTLPAISWPDRAFDVVVATETMEHLDDVDTFLEEAKRVARRTVILGVPDDVLGPQELAEHRQQFTAQSLRELLEKHFAQVEIDSFVDEFEAPQTRIALPTLLARCTVSVKEKEEALCAT